MLRRALRRAAANLGPRLASLRGHRRRSGEGPRSQPGIGGAMAVNEEPGRRQASGPRFSQINGGNTSHSSCGLGMGGASKRPCVVQGDRAAPQEPGILLCPARFGILSSNGKGSKRKTKGFSCWFLSQEALHCLREPPPLSAKALGFEAVSEQSRSSSRGNSCSHSPLLVQCKGTIKD